jgi:hypothetical protein
MNFFKRLIDFFTLGSDRPLTRLLAYYTGLALVVAVLFYFVPMVPRLLLGAPSGGLAGAGQLLQDGLTGAPSATPTIDALAPLELALATTLIMLTTLALMLPVSWVFMSARHTRDFNQSVVQTLIFLPVVVAGIVLVVQTSLALAFSLGGIVAGLRFRTTLKDVRDTVYIFLGIGVGLAAGVQSPIVAAVVSIGFNFVVLLVWRYDFGRNVLEPTASSVWVEPLSELAVSKGGNGGNGGIGDVPDRDLVLALTPAKAEVLSERFNRVRGILGSNGKKPRFNAIVSITANPTGLSQAQRQVEQTLEKVTKRWKLDEIVSTTGKPSELFYLVRARKSTTRDALLTAIRARAGDTIDKAEMEISDAVAKEDGQIRDERKKQEQA